jgi:hypothetical protein
MEYYVITFLWITGLVAAISAVSVRRSGIALTGWVPRGPAFPSRRSFESSRHAAR